MPYITRGIENLWKIQVLDEYMICHNGFIAGGCFKCLFTDEKIKDVDMFFPAEKDYFDAVKYFDDSDNFDFYYENKKVRAYKSTKTDIAIELINHIYGTPQEIIDQFDFTVTKFAYYKETTEDGVEWKIIHHKDFFEHLFFKRLVIDNLLKFPVSTFERVLRYTKKYGFGLCKESKAKLITAIKDIGNIEDLTASLYEGMD